MIINIVLFIAGLGLLAVASEHFVLGASRVAIGMRIPAIVVGAIIIGLGTSSSEFAVSALAAAQGSPELGLANVLGSNLANVLLVAGVAAILCPLILKSRAIRREVPMALSATVLLAALLALNSGLSRLDGIILLLALVGASVLLLAGTRAGPRDANDPLGGESQEFTEAAKTTLSTPRGLRFEWMRTTGGLVGTLAGSQMLVLSATGLARGIGISEIVIGVTIVAVGTSLPEIVTSIQAARRRESDLIIGNILGSNMFNSLGVAGVVAVIAPASFERGTWLILAPLGVVATALLAIMLISGRRVNSTEGIALIALYVLLAPVLLWV